MRAEGGVEAGGAVGLGRRLGRRASTPRSSSRCAPGACTSRATTRASTSTCERARRDRGARPGRPRPRGRRDGGLRPGRPRDRERDGRRRSASRSTASASAATRGARRTGTGSRWRARSAAWLDDDLAVSLTAIRPAGAAHHDDEAVAATILDHDPETDAAARDPGRRRRGCRRPTTPTAARPPPGSSSSSTRRASRAAPPARSAAGTTLDLGAPAPRTARSSAGGWRAAPGVGRYDVLRRARVVSADRGGRQRLRRRADDAADRRRSPRSRTRTASTLEALGAALRQHRRARRRAPALRARERADDRARLPRDALGAQLRADLGRDDVEMQSFAERYFAHLEPNAPMIAYLRELRGRGLPARDAHEQRARVGAALARDAAGRRAVRDRRRLRVRRPAQARPGDLRAHVRAARRSQPGQCLFVDDVEVNCDGRDRGRDDRGACSATARRRSPRCARPSGRGQLSEPSRSQR